MRAIAASSAILILLSQAGYSQGVPAPAPRLSRDILEQYCIYANQLYSVGARICLMRAKDAALECQANKTWRAGARPELR